MDGNDGVMIYLIAYPFVIGGMAAVIILLTRRSASTQCPCCFLQIPKDTIKNKVPCPECHAKLGEPLVSDVTAEGQISCRKCAAPGDCLQLWDGESYCRSCIEKQGPQLLQVAGSSQLAEDVPYSVGAITWRMFLFSVAAVGGLASLIAIPLAITGNLPDALNAFGVIFLIGSPLILLRTGMGAVVMPMLRLKVMAWNGQLIVRVGHRLIIARIAECTWHEGKVSQMTVWNHAFLLRGRALIVQLPQKFTRDGNRVAVGYTDETLDLWRSFLEIAGVPPSASKRTRWSRRKGRKGP